MAEYTLTIKLVTDGNNDVKLSTESNSQGSPSLYFGFFILSFQEQVQSSLQGKAEIAAEIAKLKEQFINCDCDDDE
ncbi:hypothetical protein [Xenorhabdus bovienii]|uniref:hypothetical protein n=1 Tax=Xenorhabdus bovienii TaxID=40576 RepID=UPI00056E1DD4|nr:hypothetical protein [Xenorhabdus bovienii]